MAADHSTGDAVAEAAWHNPLDDPFHHVVDATYFDFPFVGEVHLPFGMTKFMVLQLIAALLAVAIFVPLARKIRNGDPVGSRFWGFWEFLCVYLRDEVVRPTIGDPHADHGHGAGREGHDLGQHAVAQLDRGHDDPLKETLGPSTHVVHTHLPVAELGGHPADRYLPVIWSIFFYVLFCNLLGAIPGLGSPTGSLSVTAVLALFVFGCVLFVGMKAQGVAGFWTGLMPSLDLPAPLKIGVTLLLWPIELFGLLVKHFVLAVRLFANMMAGHTVLFVILAFISLASHSWLHADVHPAVGYGMYGAITFASIAGQIFISLLELFVAFLQAYVFAFLATLFISSAVHSH